MENTLNISVLVVDDDPVARFIHTTLIKSIDPNISCYEATNGSDALSALSVMTEPVLDIILLDIDMPLMNGFEFIEAFHKLANNEQTEIVIVSSSQNQYDINRSQTLGIRQFIPKPINRSYLESILH